MLFILKETMNGNFDIFTIVETKMDGSFPTSDSLQDNIHHFA